MATKNAILKIKDSLNIFDSYSVGIDSHGFIEVTSKGNLFTSALFSRLLKLRDEGFISSFCVFDNKVTVYL